MCRAGVGQADGERSSSLKAGRSHGSACVKPQADEKEEVKEGVKLEEDEPWQQARGEQGRRQRKSSWPWYGFEGRGSRADGRGAGWHVLLRSARTQMDSHSAHAAATGEGEATKSSRPLSWNFDLTRTRCEDQHRTKALGLGPCLDFGGRAQCPANQPQADPSTCWPVLLASQHPGTLAPVRAALLIARHFARLDGPARLLGQAGGQAGGRHMCRVQGFRETHGCPKTTGGMPRWTCKPGPAR